MSKAYSGNDYFWQGVFTLFFVLLLGVATKVIMETYYGFIPQFGLYDIILVSLATFRVTRLIVYDKIAAFVRAPFFDRKGDTMIVPASGPRRTLAELLQCPWCFGIWAALMVIFCYLYSPVFYIPILMLAVAAIGTFLQLLANMVGWKAEGLKMDVEER